MKIIAGEELKELNALRLADVIPSGIGGYELTEGERAEVLSENRRRGTLPLIELRARRHERTEDGS